MEIDRTLYDQFGEAQRAADCGNYARALEIFEGLSQQGSSDGVVNLAHFYTFGHGVPVDLDKAEELCERAISLGNPGGHLQLASVWSRRGDWSRYFSEIRQAAEKGSLHGVYFLALCYSSGRGVTADVDKALELMREAAKRGFIRARFAVARWDLIRLYNPFLVARGLYQLIATAIERRVIRARYPHDERLR